MTPESEVDARDALKDLFLRLQPLSVRERAAILDAEYADEPTLREAVLALLQADSRVSDDNFAPLVESTEGHELDEFPSQVGPYRIEALIGRGGMACVFRAAQERPIQRTVALKLLRPGFDSSTVLNRFEMERHTLARLHHRNIAQVFDAGADPYGPSWFAMELVDGPSVTEYCRTRRLDLPATLRLFSQVCRGVQHAHMRGVLHRDLKPSNILVTEEDAQPLPKIIDFGVAKALGADSPLAAQSHTLDTQVVGTLEYMSPEQARVGNPDVDARSDVYALGVVLYEVLTGSPPLNHDAMANKPFDEIQRLILESIPPKPSASDTSLPPEFDCVVLKALEKHPDDRYQSASDLADELERFLGGQPLAARSPTRLYVFSKFAKRNKALLSTATLIVILVLAGLIGTSIGLYRERIVATELAATVRELEENRLELQASLANSEQLGSLTRDIFFGIRPEREGRDVTLRDALIEAADSLPTKDDAITYAVASLADSLKDPLWTLGEYELSERMATTVIAWAGPGPDGRDPALTTEAIWRRAQARARLGNGELAESDFVTAMEFADQIGGHDPTLRYRTRVSLGEWLDSRAKYREGLDLKLAALELLEQSDGDHSNDLAIILGQVGRTYSQLGESALALEYAERGLSVREGMGTKNDLQVLSLQRTVAIVAMDAGNYEKAIEILEPHVPAVAQASGPESTAALYSGTLLGSARARAGVQPASDVLSELRSVVEVAERATPPRLHLFLRAYELNAMLAYGQFAEAIAPGDTLVQRGAEAFGPMSDQQFQLRAMLALELTEFEHWDAASQRLQALLRDLESVRDTADPLVTRVRDALNDARRNIQD